MNQLLQSSVYEFLSSLELVAPDGFVILVKDEKQARLVGDVACFLKYESHILSDFRAIRGDDLRSYQSELSSVFLALHQFYFSTKQKKILISPFSTLLHPMPTKELLKPLCLAFGDEIVLSSFKEQLFLLGYEFVDLVELAGEVSFRGDIIDIYPINQTSPIRICLFGDEIESLRYFDIQSQLSNQEELECIEILPALFNLDCAQHQELLCQIEQSPNLDCYEKSQKSLLHSYGLWFLNAQQSHILPLVLPTFLGLGVEQALVELRDFGEFGAAYLDQFLALDCIGAPNVFEDFTCSIYQAASFLELHKNKKITILSKTQAQAKQANIHNKPYKFVFDVDYFVCIVSKDELILSLNTPKQSAKRNVAKILLDELKEGDYVVHQDYGVGLFCTITQANILGGARDFIELQYFGEDKLLLPVENLDLIDRYIGDGIPMLDRLGKGSFIKLKEKLKEKLFALASEIVALAAKRELIDGVRLDVGKEEILHFQEKSGFCYTLDQQTSIAEIFADLSSGRVMDRLLSGDVGFGKTEVAMNAIFVCYLNGYQSALIAPTTLLVYQHFCTLQERLAPFGLKIARLDRFIKPKEKKAILEQLKTGALDVVVGTHALFGAEFKKLALIVIDEEHKFGVKQKETIKELNTNIHLLCMSATPIPRTLNMALSKIKGLSELKEAPMERMAVRTFVKEYQPALIKEVIAREQRRAGQVFYIYNSIASIEQKKEKLLALMPFLRIAILHSQIPSQESEAILLSFASGGYDVLVCTSIVESGIHLPNANTIIVEQSDRFGIAHLHQLRGRVGRGTKEGFCYFLLDDANAITKEASKRLLALESNAYLGSGGALAYHDLEIRGGGNLLGEAQSGHIKNVGYSLYLRMLEEAIYSLSGSIQEQKASVDVKLCVGAFLNPELIPTNRLRLELYRRLSKCESESDLYSIEDEIQQRFGKIDLYTKQFLDLILIKILAREALVVSVLSYEQNITFVFGNEKKTIIQAKSKDEEDILAATLEFLRQQKGA